MASQLAFRITFFDFFSWCGFSVICNQRFLFTSKKKKPGKGLFVDLSNEYKLLYVQRLVCSEKRVFDERWGFIFFSRNP